MEIIKSGLKKYIDEYGVEESLKGFAELLDKRVYFSINGFNVCRKELNLAIPAIAFLEDEELVLEAIHNSIDPVERQHIDKINRLSNVSVEKLVEKLERLLVKDSLEHTLRYAKELLYKDKDAFYRVLSKYALLDSINSRKTLLVSAFKKIDRKDDEIIFLLISYMAKARADYSDLEKKISENGSNQELEFDSLLSDLRKQLSETKDKLQCKLGLNIVSYVNLLSDVIECDSSKINKEDYKIFVQIIMDKLSILKDIKLEDRKTLSEVEKGILSTLILNLKI